MCVLGVAGNHTHGFLCEKLRARRHIHDQTGFRFLPLLNNPTFPAGNDGLGDEKRTAYVWLCISLPGLRRAGEMR